jgi:hypothetical protein
MGILGDMSPQVPWARPTILAVGINLTSSSRLITGLNLVKDGEGRGPGRTSRVEGFIGTEEETKRGKAGRGLYSDGETTRRKK